MSKQALVQKWVQSCGAADVFVYHRGLLDAERDPVLFAYMRKLSDAGLVFLFQRRLTAPLNLVVDGETQWEWCARRCRPKDHIVLDKVSAAIQVAPSEASLEGPPCTSSN